MRLSLVFVATFLIGCGSEVDLPASAGATATASSSSATSSSGPSSAGSGGSGSTGSSVSTSATGSGGAPSCCASSDDCPQLDCAGCSSECVSGVCKVLFASTNTCWSDADCGSGAACEGAMV